MASYKEHIAARNDADLADRFVAAAEVEGIDNPKQWVEVRVGALVAVPVSDGKSVADVYAYAVDQYKGRPGQDASYVSDEQIKAALDAVNGSKG